MDRLGFPIEKRTLQRRLRELKDNNHVVVAGEARATRYFPKGQEAEIQDSTADLIPLSPEGKEILAFVSRPEAQRIPVGYNSDFLGNYRPNIDSYLTPDF